MKKKNVLRIVLWSAVVLWMAVIFSFSAETAEESIETSDGIVELVIDKLFQSKKETMPEEEYASFRMKISHFVRKSAHFSAYMLLGILFRCALELHMSGHGKTGGLSLVACALYAASDEFHQLFVPGRGGQLTDVLIDSAGSLCGILAVTAAAVIFLRLRESSQRKNKA